MCAGYYFETSRPTVRNSTLTEIFIMITDRAVKIKDEIKKLGIRCTHYNTTEYDVCITLCEKSSETFKLLSLLDQFGICRASGEDIYAAESTIFPCRKDTGIPDPAASVYADWISQRAIIRYISEKGDDAYAFYKNLLDQGLLGERDHGPVREILEFFKKKRFLTLTKEEVEKIIEDGKKKDFSFFKLYLSKEERSRYGSAAFSDHQKPSVKGALAYFRDYYREDQDK